MILLRMLEWFNEYTGGDYWEHPDDMLKDAAEWLKKVRIDGATGRAEREKRE